MKVKCAKNSPMLLFYFFPTRIVVVYPTDKGSHFNEMEAKGGNAEEEDGSIGRKPFGSKSGNPAGAYAGH